MAFYWVCFFIDIYDSNEYSTTGIIFILLMYVVEK